jgi:hypothetical protein
MLSAKLTIEKPHAVMFLNESEPDPVAFAEKYLNVSAGRFTQRIMYSDAMQLHDSSSIASHSAIKDGSALLEGMFC